MKKENNIQFCLLSVLGIFFVVDGHLNNSFLNIGDLLPYYSFHMPLFVFISGYFYRIGSEADLRTYIRHKFVRLMLPYFIWNFIYGVLAALLRQHGFEFGQPVSLETLFIEPFRHGYQFTLNHTAWFVPTLFLTEIANAVLMKAFKTRMPGLYCKEGKGAVCGPYIIMTVCMAAGVSGIFIAGKTGASGFWLTLVKVMFLLPFLSVGILYKERLEQKDHVRSSLYFLAVLSVSLVVVLTGKPRIYAVSDCRDFTGYLLPYVTAFLGIAFWLRTARILAPACKNIHLIQYMGRNTFTIMMHHMMVFFLIKTAYGICARYGGLFVGFDYAAWKTDFYYCYLPKGIQQFKVFYLLLGLLLPLYLQKGIDYVKNRWLYRSYTS